MLYQLICSAFVDVLQWPVSFPLSTSLVQWYSRYSFRLSAIAAVRNERHPRALSERWRNSLLEASGRARGVVVAANEAVAADALR